MKTLVVVSGKGGTGKTSLTACFAVLAAPTVVADCDVDAADLHLLLDPTVERRHPFVGGRRARVKSGMCVDCGKCLELCAYDAIRRDGPGNGRFERTARVDPYGCEGCGLCARYCPERAIAFEESTKGRWFESSTRCGPMVHAQLGVAEGNSGKLVALVRDRARAIAESGPTSLPLVAGPPGVSCPVIASLTGATLVLIVTEPTRSALHDAQRVHRLAAQLALPTALVINKADIHPPTVAEVERWACADGLPLLGTIGYDPTVTAAQVAGVTVVEHAPDSTIAGDVRRCWDNVRSRLDG